MTEVVSLRPERKKGVARTQPPEGARIVFFTGVRYVRDEASDDVVRGAATLAARDGRPVNKTERRQA